MLSKVTYILADHFHFQEGIFELCRAAQTLGYLLLVVTNQAGIARGYYTEAEIPRIDEVDDSQV